MLLNDENFLYSELNDKYEKRLKKWVGVFVWVLYITMFIVIGRLLLVFFAGFVPNTTIPYQLAVSAAFLILFFIILAQSLVVLREQYLHLMNKEKSKDDNEEIEPK